MLSWQWSHFDELSSRELYQILRLRQTVFVVEQDCVYQDCDNADQLSWHLIGREEPNTEDLCAYLRVVPAGVKYTEISIGRVVTSPAVRHQGYGKSLINEGLKQVQQQWPNAAIRISAQAHLQHFYSASGFQAVSAPYDEDGIDHVEMLRLAL